jgi:hypothetical protein
MLKTYNKLLGVFLLLGLFLSLAFMVSCDDDDEGGGETVLLSYGPSPIQRGAELRFIGKNLNKVTAIVFPGNLEKTDFVSQESELLVIVVPEEAVSGSVTLKTPEGDIQPKTLLGIAEPVTITSISPEEIRPGSVVTITGTYLNLVSGLAFEAGQVVDDADFQSQSKTEITVVVPMNAQTGPVTVTDSVDTEVESEIELKVKLPTATNVSPNPVKVGTPLTISGTDLDLVTEVEFGGLRRVQSEDFTSQSTTTIVVDVPANAQAGEVVLISVSPLTTLTSSLDLIAPVITGFSPSPVKLGGNLTITGTNLDLVSSVSFGGGANVSPESVTENELIVEVPATATAETVTLNTNSETSVSTTSAITILQPAITSFTPMVVNTVDNPSITISGTNLDNVASIEFTGGWSTDVSGSASSITVNVVPGSVSGKFKLVMTNGDEIESSSALTINPNVPDVTGLPADAFLGGFLTLTGTNFNVPMSIWLPGNVQVTQIAEKTATSITFFLPMTVKPGIGKIKFVTSKNEVLETGDIEFKLAGVEPIVDPALVINNFDEAGHDLVGWDNWGGNVERLTGNPGPGISGNGNYLHGTNSNLPGWAWIWGCNHAELQKPTVTKADHVFKIDVYITEAIPANANFQMEFNGVRVNLGNLGGGPTPGWTTITYDLSAFGNLPATIEGTGEWGINLESGTVDLTGLYMDNIRFQAK